MIPRPLPPESDKGSVTKRRISFAIRLVISLLLLGYLLQLADISAAWSHMKQVRVWLLVPTMVRVAFPRPRE